MGSHSAQWVIFLELRLRQPVRFFQLLPVLLLQGCTIDLFAFQEMKKNDKELRCFLENWEFPCVAAWDGFHVYISSNLKNFFSFKKRYSVTNMGLMGHNKRFLWAGVGAPGSTHDYTLLQSCPVFPCI